MADDFVGPVPKPGRGSTASSRISNFFPKLLSGVSRTEPDALSVTSSSGKLSASPLKSIRSEGNFVSFLTRKGSTSTPGRLSPNLGTGLASPPNRSPVRGSSPKRNEAEEDYLCQAALFFSSAQKSEAEGHYHLAFSCYKAGVNQLLRGVQHEQDITRRNAVRKRTAKYLQRADRIYRYYIASDLTDESSGLWKAENDLTIQDPEVIGFQGHVSELASFKLTATLAPGVHKVRDVNSGQEFVMKFLRKTCYPERQYLRPTKVPAHVPGMAPLLKYYDLPSAIVLLLSFVKTGTLWDRLDSYFCCSARRKLLNLNNLPCVQATIIDRLDRVKGQSGEIKGHVHGQLRVETNLKARVEPKTSLDSIDAVSPPLWYPPTLVMESPSSREGAFESLLSKVNSTPALAQFSIGSVDEDSPGGPTADAGGPNVDAGGPTVDAGGPTVDAGVRQVATGHNPGLSTEGRVKHQLEGYGEPSMDLVGKGGPAGDPDLSARSTNSQGSPILGGSCDDLLATSTVTSPMDESLLMHEDFKLRTTSPSTKSNEDLSRSPPGVISFFPRIHHDSNAEELEPILEPFDQAAVLRDAVDITKSNDMQRRLRFLL